MYFDLEVEDRQRQRAWDVLNTFGWDHKWLGAQTGTIAILHTWGQTLSLHPHLPCIVPRGGFTKKAKPTVQLCAGGIIELCLLGTIAKFINNCSLLLLSLNRVTSDEIMAEICTNANC